MADNKKKTAVIPDYVDIEIDGAKYRELTVKGVKYRIGVFSPTVGSMMILQAPYFMRDETIFMMVRRNVLNIVYRYPPGFTDAPVKVFEKASDPDNDKWAGAEIDVGSVSRLIVEAMGFNMDPFVGESNTATDTPVPAASAQPQSPKG
jgi:hypothetical protein